MALVEIGHQFSLIPGEETRDFESLAKIAGIVAEPLDVPDDIQEATLELFRGYHDFHPPSATGCISAMELAVGFGGIIKQIAPEAPGSLPDIWAGGLLHDIGKEDAGIQLIRDSHAGIWPPSHDIAIQRHPRDSQRRAEQAGLPPDISLPLGGHHEVQIFRTYGERVPKTPRQIITTRAVSFGDFTDAMIGRNNKVNQTFTLGERKDRIAQDLGLLLDHEVYQGRSGEILEATMDGVVEPFIAWRLPGVELDSVAAA